MSLFWTWFGFWGQRGVGFPVCLRLALQFSLYSLFQTRHSRFASQILEARDSYLQFRGSVPLRSLAQGTQPFVGPLASPEMVSSRPELGVLTNLRFPDPGHFKAGMIHESFPVWQRLLADYSCAVDLLEILRDGVRVENFSPHLGGILRGSSTMRRPLLPFRSRTLLFAHSSLILLAIPLFSGWLQGFCPFGEKLESCLRLIWSFQLPLSRPSLVSATTKGF